MKTLLIQAKLPVKRLALYENGKLADLKIIGPGKGRAGSVYWGRVAQVVKGMEAAFIDIGLERNGFMRLEDLPSYRKQRDASGSISSYLHEGQKLMVQIKKEGDQWKGPALSGNIEFPGSSLVYMPFGGKVTLSRKIGEDSIQRLREWGAAVLEGEEGILLRTAAEASEEGDLLQELQALRKDYKSLEPAADRKAPHLLKEGGDLVETILAERPLSSYHQIFSDSREVAAQLKKHLPEEDQSSIIYEKEDAVQFADLEADVAKLQKKAVWLKNGAYLLVEKTEALHVIDVNSGKFTGRDSKQRTILETNLEAAAEAARQIRLRNLSGMILIDFIDMKEKADQQKIVSRLQSEFGRDRIQTRIIGFTELNLLQITRKKTSEDLAGQSSSPCRVCGGSGAVPSAETAALELVSELRRHRNIDSEAIWVEADGEVKALFEEMGEDWPFKLFLTSGPFSKPEYIIRQVGDEAEIRSRILQ
ncbi:Rne/Rng family ribonuclease [Metabacillus mangrovi]|uniref:Rne/Rng family ribonuclease n=1 Tax=Metabacillus mangrovi TaxID=1491830 RepID=UPI0013914EB3|nr:Rne/Rng family ribonuclease [Metabacillus mangrovi]